MTDELEDTHRLSPFETLVLRRFDQVDARLDALAEFDKQLDERMTALEARKFDTKPIWERALAEILDVSDRLRVLQEMFTENTTEMRVRHLRLEKRVAELEGVKP